MGQTTKRVAFDFHPAKGKAAKSAKKQRKAVLAEVHDKTKKAKRTLELPKPQFAEAGKPGPSQGRGCSVFKKKGLATTAHTAATAYPYVAGPSLGHEGAMIGHDLHGGGAFCFDPWELYRKGVISGMSMLLFGQLGTGKSSLAKAMAVRLVQLGRRLSVASDKKGEWTKVVRALQGNVIQVGPGLETRLNPLDEGVRPSLNVQGRPMDDDQWRLMVRSRRLSILKTLVKILIDRQPDSAENWVIGSALDLAVGLANEESRAPIIPDLIDALEQLREENASDPMRADAANRMSMTLQRMTTGDLAGMFDGPSTVKFDVDAPATSIDTSSSQGANPVAVRVISACAGSWMESMVTNSDGGQRVVIYEEGWDNLTSEADLQRMVEQWKLARHYGIFNVLIMHKVSDLDMAGAQGSAMEAMAHSLLADADVKVIYRQDSSALRVTAQEMQLSPREKLLLKSLKKGTGLWRVGEATFEVANDLTRAELPLFDTDSRMDKHEVSPREPEPAETATDSEHQLDFDEDFDFDMDEVTPA